MLESIEALPTKLQELIAVLEANQEGVKAVRFKVHGFASWFTMDAARNRDELLRYFHEYQPPVSAFETIV